MAELRATPMVNPVMGLLADRLKKVQQFGAKPFGYENPPVEMLMNLLGVPAVQQTMERMAYGEPLTTGRGMTTKPRAEAVEAALAVAPVAGLLGKATKGLPVGASIEDVGKSIVREGNPIQSAVVLIGDKIFTGRTHTEAFNRAIYEGVVRKEGGKFIYPKNAEVNSDLFMTKDGQIIDRFQASKMFDIGASETAIEKGLMQNKPASSMTIDSYIKQAEKLKKQKKSAPQQEALDTAQRNAALPVEEGGLGLPKDNTAMDRAEAMGFIDAYHGTTQGARKEQLRNAELWATDNPKVANTYATGRPEFGRPEGQTVMPLSVRLENPMVIDAPFGASWRQIDTALPNDPEVLPYSTDMLSDIAKKQGYDSLVVKNVFDVGGGKIPKSQKGQDALTGTTYAVFDPAQVRSRFAAFDPKRRSEADILAGVLPLGLLADEEQRKKIYELMPSLLGQ